MSANSCNLMGYQVRYERVGYGPRCKHSNRFSSGRKFPDHWEKTCWAVFVNDIFLGVINGCGSKWYLIAPDLSSPVSSCVTCGLSRNDAMMAYINRYFLSDSA